MLNLGNIEGLQGVSFGTLQQLLMAWAFVYFYIKNKEQRPQVAILFSISVFWFISSITLSPAISDYNGILYFVYKAIIDAICAIGLLIYHVGYKDGKDDKFYLAKFLAYIFWCNFVLNICAAIEQPTVYVIVYEMYDYLSPILNLLQVVILSGGVQNYVSGKIECSTILHVHDRSDNSWARLVFQCNNKTYQKSKAES